MKKSLLIWVYLLNVLAISSGQAQNPTSASSHTLPPPPNFYALSFGPAWTQPGEMQTFFLFPDVQKAYNPNIHTRATILGEITAGYHGQVCNYFNGMIGLAIGAGPQIKLSGDIWEDGDPNFNEYFYDYHVSEWHIAMKGRLATRNLTVLQSVQPYVSASLGLGFNRAFDFSITPKDYANVPSPPFTNHTSSAFSYTLGAGLQKEINSNWQVALGYDFADWGKSNLSKATGQLLNSGLLLNHFFMHELQISLIYLT